MHRCATPFCKIPSQRVQPIRAVGEESIKINKHPLLHNINTKEIYKNSNQPFRSKKDRKNLQNVFLAKKRAIVENKDILLVDDIFTTGSTLRSASKALIDAGAKKITILVLARR